MMVVAIVVTVVAVALVVGGCDDSNCSERRRVNKCGCKCRTLVAASGPS
jgi:hypothetical protein